MKGLRALALLVVVVVVGLVAGTYAVNQDPPAMTADEARAFTRAALTAVEARNPMVGEGEVRADGFTPEGSEPIPVWVVPATVSGQPLELYVMRAGDRAVNLDDALPEGGFVLPSDQFAALELFRLDLAGERVRESRQGPALVAGVLIALVGVALLLSVVTGLTGRARTTGTDAEQE